MKIHKNLYDNIISLDNLFSAWEGFKRNKRKKKDVMRFEMRLEPNLFDLHKQLKHKTYRHGRYTSFFITDPKQRHIHKASVGDRIIHHAVFSVLNPIFEPTFIFTSYSCRKAKGTHKGIIKFAQMLRKVSGNNQNSCYVLKCDIRKFFQSVDHSILLSLLKRKIKDPDTIGLLSEIINSFPYGLPIGNLTSQLFANIYLTNLDYFVKHSLRVPFYIRYTDDFVIVSEARTNLLYWLEKIKVHLAENLKLDLHPTKILLRKYEQGTDFLGYVQYPHYRLLRTKTKRRIFKKASSGISEQSLQSYLGVLSHSNSYKLSQDLKNLFWFKK